MENLSPDILNFIYTQKYTLLLPVFILFYLLFHTIQKMEINNKVNESAKFGKIFCISYFICFIFIVIAYALA